MLLYFMIGSFHFHHRSKVTWEGNTNHTSNHSDKYKNKQNNCANYAEHKRELEREKNIKRVFQYSQHPLIHQHIGEQTSNAPYALKTSIRTTMSYGWSVDMCFMSPVGIQASTDAQSVEVELWLSQSSHTSNPDNHLKLKPQLRTYSLHHQVPHRVEIDKRKVPEARQSQGLAHPTNSLFQ